MDSLLSRSTLNQANPQSSRSLSSSEGASGVVVSSLRNWRDLTCGAAGGGYESPIPSALGSSGSSQSSLNSDNESNASAHSTASNSTGEQRSPNSICRTRNMSAAVVTSLAADHGLLMGRPKIVVRAVTATPPKPQLQQLQQQQPPSQQQGDDFSESQQHQQLQHRQSYGSSPAQCHKTSLRRTTTVPIDARCTEFAVSPAPLRLDAWSDTPAHAFSVRGPRYLQDRQKVPSLDSVFQLLTVDLVKVDQPIYTGLCSHPGERVQQALKRERETGMKELPNFVFAVNLCVPGTSYYHWVAYFGLDDLSLIQDTDTPLGRVAKPFFFGTSDEYCSKTFKLIPRIVDGNFVVKSAVGSKPTILGKKLKQYYIRNERFFEIIIDIGSDCVANKIVKLALGYAKTLTVDMMFLLEGHDATMLPERILAGARMKNIDFKKKDGQRTCQATV